MSSRPSRLGGYKSSAKAKTQAVMVAQTLSRLVRTGHLRKRGRGKYAAKAG